ncbi:HEXXH motif-containing putative peptide modification protein [Streptomyces sp. NPDC004111]|uniref:aKG-HExxH-type peptide beta-hydroxylase n=1 Tax=Streptomyces sp. NPDC004111 TaxID=3364690 RepID=UPI0036CD0A8C
MTLPLDLTLDGTAEMLRWGGTDPDLPRWRAAYEQALDERLTARDTAHPDAYGPVVRALDTLPPAHRRSFLRAPQVSSLLLHDTEGTEDAELDAALLEQALVQELTVEGLLPARPDREVWNLRGNARRSASGERESGEELPGLDVALDTASPIRFPDGDFGLAAGTVRYSAEQLGTVMQRVSAAADILTAMDGAARFVDTFSEVVALREEHGPASVFHSSSFSGLVGLCRLTNAHLDSVTPGLLAESLVHESTHAMLYLYEEVREPFLRRPDANDRSVTSPWTGATIRLQSFLHACAVWYAVHWYWERARAAGLCDPAQAEERTALARRGFRAAPAARALREHSAVLTGSARDLLEQLDGATSEFTRAGGSRSS